MSCEGTNVDACSPASTSSTCFTDGMTPINISPSHLKLHPLHSPTGTTQVLTFYPTLDEFRDFKGYIEKIEKNEAHLKCGIAKIVPPEGWNPRPTKKNTFSDLDEYTINNPVEETIEGESGVYYKTNRLYKKKISVKEFRKIANSPTYKNPNPHLEGTALENEYFNNIVKHEPIYGADTEGSVYDDHVNEFNMNRLNTILDETKNYQRISGVNTVYLYFGMYKTTFPWHSEDMDLYSINYLHFGAPKYWFSISSDSAARFERLMQQMFPADEQHCKAFLRHKCHIISPEILRAYDIPYGTMIQRPNEFIITFPKGYHMGFNTGYNLAESTNFATDRWIDYGKNAALCKCTKDMVEIDMRPFMQKYRPNEYERWFSYWYGDQQFSVFDIIGGTRKRRSTANLLKMLPKKSRNDLDNNTIGSDNDRDVSWKPLIGNKMDVKISSSVLELYDFSVACEKIGDYEEMKKQWKKCNKDVFATNINFEAEKAHNELNGRLWPHCDVCSNFQPVHMKPIASVIPKNSIRLINNCHFAKEDDGSDHWEHTFAELITCECCKLTVHVNCYPVERDKDADGWYCQRCRKKSEIQIQSASCSLCELRGGALVNCRIGTDISYVHVICAIFNRRALFVLLPDFAVYIEPSVKQKTRPFLKYDLPEEYKDEFGDTYEDSKWECLVCGKLKEGLIPCSMCIDEGPEGQMPVLAHATCARSVGFALELRDFPRNVVMICHRHIYSHLINTALRDLPVLKIAEQVYANNNGNYEKGTIESIESMNVAVVDFLDGSVTRDLSPEDIKYCECFCCDGTDHQFGARVKVIWDDDELYDGYFRGLMPTDDFSIRLDRGIRLNLPRAHVKSKREMSLMKL